MKFLHLAAADHGGAGLAAKRLHDGLRSAGHASRMLVLDRRSSDDDIMAFPAAASPFRLRRQAVKAGLKVLARPDYYFQNQRLSPGRVPALADLGSPHVIIVHSISHFISFQDVLDLHKATSAPVIWHLLDMGILTGGCHYAWACRKYESACESCPALRLPSKRDLSARAWAQKRAVAPMIRGVVVAGSSTLARQARASALFASSTVETVLLGVAPEHFYPRDRWAERREFGIVGQGQVIFFGAQRFDQRRKGMSILLHALGELARMMPATAARPSLLSAGDASDFRTLGELGFEHVSLGYIDERTLARAYAAADLFACPSIEDSGPMMINESLMSGAPVVAFDIGVVPDLIESGVTGEIATLNDPKSFAQCLAAVLSWTPERRAKSSARCRTIALEKCAPTIQVRRFEEIAGSLSAQASRPSITAYAEL